MEGNTGDLMLLALLAGIVLGVVLGGLGAVLGLCNCGKSKGENHVKN
ncbi:MAG: hypothetical protein OEW11_09680 [Nitrospirota bacterium]|nr:hypothetical protein [Nitrospirota bacterium]